MNCKYCQSTNTIKFGTHNEVQRYYCKDCKRKFTEKESLIGMRTPTIEIADALQSFYEGMSINGIRRNLKQQYSHYPSESTVYDWITKYTKDIVNRTNQYKPEVGYVWLADETMIDINGTKHWLWDIIDYKTRFLLASHISTKRTVDDAMLLMHKANLRAGKFPKVIMTDSLNSYMESIALTYKDKARHLQVKKFTSKPNNNLIERMQGTIKSRTKVMRGLKSYDTAKLILSGFIVYYNYMRPHLSLQTRKDKYVMPAEKANVVYPFENWLEYLKVTEGKKSEEPKPISVQFDILPSDKVAYQRVQWRTNKRIQRAKIKKTSGKISSPSIMTIRRLK